MLLGISAVRHANEEFVDPVTTPLSAVHCTIGRGQECDVVLEDPSRRVSRKHATIVRQGDDYVLCVNSQINPVVVNGQIVTAGQEQALHAGDQVIIGDYEFSIVPLADSAPAGRAAPLDPLAALGQERGGPVDLDALFGEQSARPGAPSPTREAGGLSEVLGKGSKRAPDPLLDILGGRSDHDQAAGPAFKTADADPLAKILGHDASSAGATTGSPDEFVHGGGSESPIDALLHGSAGRGHDPLGLSSEVPVPQRRGRLGGGTGGSDELDHVHDVHLPFSMPEAAPAAAPPPRATPLPIKGPIPPARPSTGEDPLAALLGEAAGPERPASDLLGLLSAPAPEPIAREAQPMPPGSAPDTGRSPYLSLEQLRAQTDHERADVPAGSATASIAAFLRGAGMPEIAIPQGDAETFLEECGATVRAAVEGLMGMLLARAKVKEELRASDRTMVATRENNPLKLIESVDEALKFVFDPATRTDAFLPPPKAVADACGDLQAHELALVAGMRAALIGAIKRFEPAIIETRLQKEGGKSLLANKKALLWDCFVAYYKQTETDAEDNFDRVFGAAFLRAYQEQVRRLRG